MLPIATVKWTPREFTAQAADETWFKLILRLEANGLRDISNRIHTAMAEPKRNVMRRITFTGPAAEQVRRLIEQ